MLQFSYRGLTPVKIIILISLDYLLRVTGRSPQIRHFLEKVQRRTVVMNVFTFICFERNYRTRVHWFYWKWNDDYHNQK